MELWKKIGFVFSVLLCQCILHADANVPHEKEVELSQELTRSKTKKFCNVCARCITTSSLSVGGNACIGGDLCVDGCINGVRFPNGDPCCPQVLAKVCDIQTRVETIETKVCMIDDELPCDFIILDSDIPLTITQPGTYCLGESVDFTGVAGAAIEIQASNVTLDLNGHCMDGGTSGDRAVRSIGNDEVIIKNGSIKDYRIVGIRVTDSNFGSIIQDIQISATRLDTGGPDSGIFVFTSTAVRIDRCTVLRAGQRVIEPNGSGIDISNSDDCIVTDCICQECGNGFGFSGSSHTQFNNCTAIYNAQNGFIFTDIAFAPGCADHTIIQSCKALANAFDGFLLRGTNYSVVRDCISHRNGEHGISIESSARRSPISMTNSQLIQNCSLSKNGLNGINITAEVTPILLGDLSSRDTVIVDCKLNNNGNHGIFIGGTDQFGDGPKSNLIRNCEILDNELNGIELSMTSSANKVINCVLEKNDGVGINNAGMFNVAFNNCALDNLGGNYSGIALVETAPSATTGFWINVSQ